MSRSIHSTRRAIRETELCYYADSGRHAARLERLHQELARKRRIKWYVKEERPRRAAPASPQAPESIPIRVVDAGECIHYPATPADILEVMRLLPPGLLSGISSIDLCLGDQKDTHPVEPLPDGGERDPLIGRLSDEVLPGVFAGRTLAMYSPDRARIRVFAYVYEPTIPHGAGWDLYLRLQMLSALVHEIAHHVDATMRVARGKWCADVEDKNEIYARDRQYDWVRQYVVPYLERTYPDAVQQLDAWVRHHGGTSVPLWILAGDPRSVAKGGGITDRGIFSMSGALEDLAKDVANSEAIVETRLQFARDLHYVEYYHYALEIIDRVLRTEPDHPEALTLQGDIYVHQERYHLAQTVSQRVVAIDDANSDAWKVLADAYEGLRDWTRLAFAATRILELAKASRAGLARALLQRARARLELGELAAVDVDLQEIIRSNNPKRLWLERKVAALREELSARLAQAARLP